MMKLLAWVALALAIIAGAGLAATAATLVMLVVVIVVIGRAVIDIAKDRTPNMDAVIAAIVIPTLILNMPGKGPEKVRAGYAMAWDAASDWLGGWLGTTSMLTVAIVVTVVSAGIAKKTMATRGMGMR